MPDEITLDKLAMLPTHQPMRPRIFRMTARDYHRNCTADYCSTTRYKLMRQAWKVNPWD